MIFHIAIIDQNETYRESLRILLSQVKDFRIVLVSGDGDCLFGSDNFPIHVLLLDSSFGKEKCAAITSEAEAQWGSIKTLILATFREDSDPNCETSEIILKNSDKKEFEREIKRIMAINIALNQVH
jgi:DNA-binding NarL/FixJ family response regulator